MGASANEIERQIAETRSRMDQNLTVLEHKAATNAVRYGRIAGVAIGALAAAGVGFLVYRRMRRPSLKDRVSVNSLREFAGDLRSRFKKLPSVTVSVNDHSAEPGLVEGILRDVGPAIVGTASTALIERVAGTARPQAD
jgi:hypothetical protein